MAKARPDVAFVRIGKVNRQVQMLLEQRHLNNVFHFTSLSVTNLREFYRHADLFVQPSFQEGFGLPPLEAIACGTPVVCAKTTALDEIFSGVCPTVSPATNVQGYLDVLQSVLDGKYEYDAEKVSKLLARYSIKTIADKLSAFFYSILDR
jgi:glycosyltransferase involved in cell wall biosynthesis